MTRTMADSIIAENLPESADFWGMYVNGRWPTYYLRQPAPGVRIVRISINASTFAEVYDVESGDLRPQDVPAALHTNPVATIYASLNTWQFVREICKAANIAVPPWWAAVPGYTGIYPGSVATQNRQVGGCDISDVADYWPGVDIPTQRMEGQTKVFLRRDPSTGRIYLQTADGHLYWIPDTSPDLTTLRSVHGTEVNLTPDFLKQFDGYIPASA